MIIPVDELTITDQQMFHALNLKIPGLEKTNEAFAIGDIKSAKKHLCNYFYTRSNVHFFFDFRGETLRPIDPSENPYAFQASLGFGKNLKQFCLDAGEKMMRNIYVLPGEGRGEVDLGSSFETMIHYNFLTDNGKSHRHHLDLFVRGQFFEYLAILYHENGDKKVLAQFRTLLYKFFEEYALQVVDTAPSANRFQYDEDRDAMSVGFLALTYLTLLYTRLPYDAGDEVVFDIIKHLWFLGLQFRRFDTDSYKPHNHHMWERGLIPFMLGTLLPEIPAFVEMRDHGAAIVCRHVHEDFNEQGGYSEHSIAYWAGAALGEMLYRGVCLSRLNKVALLDEGAMNKLDNSFSVLAAICPPQDRYPPLGDNRAPLINSILQLGIAMTDNALCREQLLARTSNRLADSGIIPPDYQNERTGFVCLHGGVPSKEHYLLMSTKTHCGSSGHNHMDMLSLFVTIRGKAIFGEPYADQLYRKGRLGTPQRGYLYNMAAHNTVLAFGQPVVPDRMLADQWGVYRPDSPVTALESTPEGAYASAYHVGYPHCRHTRKLLFSRNGALLVRDEIARGNRVHEPHIQRWHLEPDCSVSFLDSATAVIEREGVSLLCIWEKNDSIALCNDSEILCPSITADCASLAPIIDVSFSNMQNQTTDLLMVPLNMLMLDITERGIPNLNDLREQLSELALVMDTPDAIVSLSNM